MSIKCLAQEHNTMTPARARTQTARSGVERTNREATAPPADFEASQKMLMLTVTGFTKAQKLNLLARMCSMWKCFAEFKEKHDTETGTCLKATRNRSQQESQDKHC